MPIFSLRESHASDFPQLRKLIHSASNPYGASYMPGTVFGIEGDFLDILNVSLVLNLKKH